MESLQNGSSKSKADNDFDVVLRADGLKVWTPEEKSWWRRKVTKPRLDILNEVSGTIRSGEFVAVIGPSGAGKTTFLVSLAGKCTLPAEGVVTANGVNVKDLKQGFVEIVPQFEVFMESLNVEEHLIFMTEMKLGSIKKSENRIKLNKLMAELMLRKHAQTAISGLSGGERRLLSLASSLLSSPNVVICDEPTTGLDSYNALLVILTLKRLALRGLIVVCSVHQPSSDLFKEFNSIVLMAEGKLLFHGTHDRCQKLFERINLSCPRNYNPAEFYIRAVSNDPNSNSNHMQRIMETYQNRFLDPDDDDRGVTGSLSIAAFKIVRRNWFKQVSLLVWRSSLTIKREVKDHIFQLFTTLLLSGLVIATCYVGISGTTQKGVQDMRGFIWMLTSEVSYGISYNALFSLENELTLFKRESGMYSGSAFFVSRFLGYIPRCTIWPILFVAIASTAVQLPNHMLTSLEFMAALMATALAATAYGLAMAALFSSTNLLSDVMPCADLPLFLVSGTFLRLSSIPLWMYGFKYVSHFYYGMDAMSNIYWRQIGDIDCASNSTENCLKDGLAVLQENGYSSNFLLQDSIGLLLVTLGWSFIAYCGLKREEKKGYVY